MRLRYWFALVLVTVAYLPAAYAVLYVLPFHSTYSNQFDSIRTALARDQLSLQSQESIRSGLVTLLTASTLGVAGFVAFLSFGAARRDADMGLRRSQNELFRGALETIGQQTSIASIGAISLLVSLAMDRTDLREPAASTLFALTRSRIRLAGTIEGSPRNRGIGNLADRDALAAAALHGIGRVPGVYKRGAEAGSIISRSLDGCDLRKWRISGARFEVVSFVGSYFWDSTLMDCEFVKCSFAQTDWTGVELRRVRFKECDLRFTNIMESNGLDVRAEECRGLEAEAVVSRPQWLIIE